VKEKILRCIGKSALVCMLMLMCACVHVCMCACVHVCLCICMFLCLCVCVSWHFSDVGCTNRKRQRGNSAWESDVPAGQQMYCRRTCQACCAPPQPSLDRCRRRGCFAGAEGKGDHFRFAMKPSPAPPPVAPRPRIQKFPRWLCSPRPSPLDGTYPSAVRGAGMPSDPPCAANQVMRAQFTWRARRQGGRAEGARQGTRRDIERTGWTNPSSALPERIQLPRSGHALSTRPPTPDARAAEQLPPAPLAAWSVWRKLHVAPAEGGNVGMSPGWLDNTHRCCQGFGGGGKEGERREKGGCCHSVRGCVQARGTASGSKRYSRCLRGGGHAGGLVISLPESPMPAPQRYPLPVSPLGKDGERRLVDSVCELE